jgi:repressor LexA
MTFGDRLRLYRTKKGISREYISKTIGVQPTAYSNYESDSRFPSKDVLIKLSDCLGISLDILVKGVESDGNSREEVSDHSLRIIKSLSATHKGLVKRFDYMPDILTASGDRDGYFYLKVSFESMISDRIKIGDMILIHENKNVPSGKLALMLLNRVDTVLGRLYRKNDIHIVQPANTVYPPYFLTVNDLDEGKLLVAGIAILGQYSLDNNPEDERPSSRIADDLQYRIDSIL